VVVVVVVLDVEEEEEDLQSALRVTPNALRVPLHREQVSL